MKKEEYISSVLEQVRCKAVHEPLKRELEAHIDDQTEAFIDAGMPEEIAEKEAVKTMGDPIETGVGLDSAHRPRFPLATVITAALLLFGGVIARHFLERYFVFSPTYDIMENSDIPNVLICIAAIAIFYFADYTIFARRPKIAYVVCTVLLAITVIGNVSASKYLNRNGAAWEIIFASNTVSGWFSFYGSALLAPIMCGFAFSMRGKGFGGFVLTCFALVIPPAFIAFYAPCISAAILVGLTALTIMTAAVRDGYFKVNKTEAYLFMYIPASLAAIGVTLIKLLRNIRYNGSDADWEQNMIRKIIEEAVLFGKGGNSDLTSPNNSHILTAIIAHFGIIAGIAVSVLILILPIIMLVTAGCVQNRFGRLIAISIGMVFLFESAAFIAANFGLTTAMESFVTAPLMSGGILNMIANGALIGIYASIYSRKDLMPERKIDIDRAARA